MKTCVITGAGGVLCSAFAAEMAKNGYAVALLDINEAAARAVADKITAEGGTARAYTVSVLDRAALEAVHGKILADLGKCTVLINGAGGNNPRATTLHETYVPGDEDVPAEEFLTFFNLDKSGFDFVFDLNIKGVLLPTQVFAKDMIGEVGCSILNISSISPAGSPCILLPQAFASTPLPPASLPRIRTARCSSTRTAPPPPARAKFLPLPPWGGSARRKSCLVL